MPSLPTLPQRSWLERTSLGLAAAITLLAALTLAGWWMRIDGLLQLGSNQAVMKANSALAFLAVGLALLALELGKRKLVPVAVIATGLGLVSLVQDIFRVDLQVDQMLGRDHLLFLTEYPGRIPAMVAACLVLGSMVLIWCAMESGAKARLFAEAVVGSVLASAGLSTLLGYGAGLQTVYTWGTDTATSPGSAIALCLLGAALLLIAWRNTMKTEGEAPSWSPMPAVIGCLTLSVVLWIGLRERERTFTSTNTMSQMDQFVVQIKDAFDKQASQIERIARKWGDGQEKAESVWQTDARQMLELGAGELGGLSIALVNARRRTVWSHPGSESGQTRDFDHTQSAERSATIDLAESTRGPQITPTTPVLTPAGTLVKGIVIYSPVIRAGAIAGFVAAEYDYRQFFQHIATTRVQQLLENYHIAVYIGGEPVFKHSDPDFAVDEKLALDKTYGIAGRRIRVSLTPTETALSQTRLFLPQLALAAGIGITVFLGLSVHLARSARAGQRAAEQSNRRLFAENEERRRIEARLKVSDERLRLALDSTQIGIIEWSVAAGHVYYSPGLWAMLGYEHTRMPSTVETWQSLVHPDDLPIYRRRTEAQLSGLVAFIDPEYRVRSHHGDWRWVYARSKSVASNADGRPTRIIGTVQDITARRDAEQALRESQAEARKLSLVAAKTDNPVLIGSPDGRIEWANEAFCRVMEYSLEEV
ncbi:MAG: PAS domain-containing protein, partial [Armatimonadetes bacterium]|nr:PAS domain-containing protein [Armatimonadota bacterium]